jgi:SNF2 family DNA or RNA helicase
MTPEPAQRLRVPLDQYPWVKLPKKYQYWALDNSWAIPSMSIDAEMGLGKTFITIANAGLLYINERITHMIVFAPKSVCSQWVSEFEKFWPADEFQPVMIHRWDGMTSKREAREWRSLTGGFRPGDPLRVLVMNIESQSTQKGRFLAEKFVRSIDGDCMAVVDESTRIKGHTAQRTSAAVRLSKHVKYTRTLSGLPTPNSPLDAYAPYCFLSGVGKMECPILGFTSQFQFKNRYAILEKTYLGPNKSFQDIKGWQRLDELYSKMRPHRIRLTKADCLDLPEKTYVRREVELTPEQKVLYKELIEHTKVELKAGTITSFNMLVKLLRFQQLVSGWMTTEEGGVLEIPSRRMAALLEVVEEIPGKVIVWAHFQATIEGIVKALREEGYSAEAFYGKTSQKDRDRIIEEFQKGDLRFFVGNPSTAGFGLNLTAASTQVFFSRDFSLETRLQAEDRTHRIGQTNPCTYIDLVTPNTVDDHVLTALRSKRELSSKLLGEKIGEWI